MTPYSKLSKQVPKGLRREMRNLLSKHAGVMAMNRLGDIEFGQMNMMTFHRDYERPNWDTKGMQEANP